MSKENMIESVELNKIADDSSLANNEVNRYQNGEKSFSVNLKGDNSLHYSSQLNENFVSDVADRINITNGKSKRSSLVKLKLILN